MPPSRRHGWMEVHTIRFPRPRSRAAREDAISSLKKLVCFLTLCGSQGTAGGPAGTGRCERGAEEADELCHRPFAGLKCFLPKEACLPRKEVIQPHLPVRLPCYDFTPLTDHTFDTSLPFRGWAGGFGCKRLGWCDGRCVQGPGTHSPRRADPRLLATPTSRGRVAAPGPNWGRLWGFAPPRGVAARCAGHCSTCAAQRIRGMMT